ncbi:MAG: Hsp20/alpha crystallin family protein [candidate division WOR-3 bacterium]
MTNWLLPWDPFKEITDLRKKLDQFFEFRPRSRRGFLAPLTEEFYPAVDVYDKKDSIVLKAEIPGVDKKDISISISEDEITIKGEVKREEEVKEQDYYRCERAYGSFSRTIPLPTAVDKEKAKATYKDGVLVVTLPKSEAAKPKEIKVPIE